MNEQEKPFSEENNRDNNNSFVPKYIFEEAWQDGNFLIPSDKDIRDELRRELEKYLHYGVMHQPENEKIRKIISARISAIEAYDETLPD